MGLNFWRGVAVTDKQLLRITDEQRNNYLGQKWCDLNINSTLDKDSDRGSVS